MKFFLKYRFAAILALILTLLSCTREASREVGKGTLQLSIGSQAPELIVRSGFGSVLPAFGVDIVGEDGKHSYSVADSRDFPADGLEIAAGVYTVSVESIPGAASEWGEAVWAGSTKVTVKPEQKTSANINCTMSNTMVSAEFDESISSSFSSWALSVDNGGMPLVFSSDAGTQNDTAWFDVSGVLNYSVEVTTKAGKVFRKGPESIGGVTGGKHYRFQITTREDGSVFLMVMIDGSTVYNVDSESADNSHINELTALEGDSAEHNMMFMSSRGIASLAISHQDDGLTAAGVPEWTDLVTSQSISGLLNAGFVCEKVPFGSKDVHTIAFGNLLGRLAIGDYEFKAILTDVRGLRNEVVWRIGIVPPVESKISSVNAWARFAVLKGEWVTASKPEGLRFQYSAAGSGVWTDISDGLRYDESSRSYSADIYGLEPGQKYLFRSVTNADISNDKEFPEISVTTDANVPTVPYMDFDNWCKSGDAWMPNPSGAATVWDTANPGTASLGTVPTTPESSDVVSGQAVRMESTTAGMLGINKFAAGNIYLGQFNKVEGTTGASLKWGYRFNGRPIALRGYYKYKPVNIDYAESPMTHLKGTPDWGSIRIFLCNWSQQFLLNTATGNFLQEDDPSVIASAGLYFNTSNSSYVRFTLPIHYNDDRTPTFIEIACAASRYGDYFTGGKGSVLLIDEFELVYDAAELTEEEREAIGYR